MRGEAGRLGQAFFFLAARRVHGDEAWAWGATLRTPGGGASVSVTHTSRCALVAKAEISEERHSGTPHSPRQQVSVCRGRRAVTTRATRRARREP